MGSELNAIEPIDRITRGVMCTIGGIIDGVYSEWIGLDQIARGMMK